MATITGEQSMALPFVQYLSFFMGCICMQVPLVGAVGQDFVHTVLSSTDPQSALREIQKRGAFKNRRSEPLLRLLDHLGLKRCLPCQIQLPSAGTWPHKHAVTPGRTSYITCPYSAHNPPVRMG